ncbi:hypothetical protein BJX65DRAFT_299571 [Aspergillus insuetus]
MDISSRGGATMSLMHPDYSCSKMILPTLCAFIFLGTVREQSNAATTTAVACYWPTLLSSDSAVSTGIPFRVLFFRYAGMVCTMLISIAAIVTPLGLYESILLCPEAPALFHHLPDSGIFGTGTTTRNASVPWSRACGGSVEPFTCPDLTRGTSLNNETMDRSIPDSISSIFDIQWRLWTLTRLSERNRSNFTMPTHPSYYEPYPIGIYRQISTIVLEDGYTLIEGLVIDTKRGGAGFRNHSALPLTTYGSTWSEDLLFIQPVSACVDTNLALDYAITDHESYNLGTSITPMTLTDRGGFSRLNTTYPTWDIAEQPATLGAKLNISNVTLGTEPIQHLRLRDSSVVPGAEVFPITRNRAGSCSINISNPAAISPNGFGCYVNNDTDLPEDGTFEAAPRMIRDVCEGGEFERSRGTLGNIATYCTLILGASQRSDSGSDDENNNWPLHTPNSAWSIPMYSCAMAVEATIKTVTFSFHTTDDLTGLSVLNITDKDYDTDAEYPLWAVEILSVDMGRFWMRPLWGLVSREAAANFSTEQLKTVQKPSFLLPRSSMLPRGSSVVPQDTQNLPGVEFPNAGMAYGKSGLMDYTGEGNLALSRRWNMLSRSADSMARVMNLVWTDYVSNAVVGTKGSPQESGAAIQYHLAYAIPAVVMLAILALTSFLALVAFLLGRATVSKMKRYLNATSAGRIMVSVLHRPLVVTKGVDNDTSTHEWVGSEGRIEVTAGTIMPILVLGHGLGGAETSTLLKGPAVSQQPLSL